MQQLVIQFPLKAIFPDEAELDSIVEIEERLDELAGGRFDVDGHDAGNGEMNIFIITDDAADTFELVREHLPADRKWRAGFRDDDADEYVPLAPKDLPTFEVR
jgi:hypothetical protein